MSITFLTNLQNFLNKNGWCFQQLVIKSDCEEDHWYEVVITTDSQKIVLRGVDNCLRISEIDDLNLVDNND